MRSLILFSFLLLVGSQATIFAQCNIFTATDPNIIQTNCGGVGMVCTNLPYGGQSGTRFLLDGQTINTTSPCAFDTLRYYPINPVVAIGNFAPYYLDNWRINGIAYSTEFIYPSQLLDSMNVWDPTGDWVFNLARAAIVGGNAQNDYGTFSVEIIITNTTLSSEYTTELIPTQLGVTIPIGLHLLEAWNVAEQCRDSLVVNVVCTQPARLDLRLEQGQSRIICLDTEELLRQAVAIRNLSNNPTHYTWETISENCVQFNGRSIGTDMAQILICDRFGVCDTTNIAIEVGPPTSRAYYQAILLDEIGEFCVDKEALAMPSPIEQFTSACASNTDILQSEYDDNSLCVQYEGLQVGTTEECLRICDRFGNCDTLGLYISVVEPMFIYDTLLVNAETGTYCLDITGFDRESLQINRSCVQENTIIKFNETNLCFTYESDIIEQDSTCIWLIDQAGNAQYIVLNVVVRSPVPAVQRDSVFINQSIEICLSTDELPGQLRSIENICPENADAALAFFVLNDRCVEVTGLELGEGEGCFVLCDNFGYCDTTYLQIRVVPYLEIPNAEDDAITVEQTETTQIPIQANDNVLGGVERIRILVSPQYGQAYVELNGQISYIPDPQNCIGSDVFQYEICNSVGCDIATVTIEINCAGVEIYTAMSPNGDGLNDAFFVANIDAYPINTLKIYNRWGALVYEQNNYQNDWFGTWNGRILPDGAYFYLLEINENGAEQIYRGHVELHR